MAVYKVPQDVEADDKLIGPFTFRQFIYLVIVCAMGALAYFLGTAFLPLAIIPLPAIILFGALALPLRKDQPMETYLAAIISYYLKPHQRIWEADGVESLVEITAPKVVEEIETKNLSEDEAQRRLDYLANIVDTQGWAVRGVGAVASESALNTDIYFEAQQTPDILDEDNGTVQSIENKLDQSDAKRRQAAAASMSQGTIQQSPATLAPTITPSIPTTIPQTTTVSTLPQNPTQKLVYNPYPNEMQQNIIQPLTAQDRVAIDSQVNTSEKPASPAIINLANNNNLSVEAIAREASRIQEKQDLKEEVVITLR